MDDLYLHNTSGEHQHIEDLGSDFEIDEKLKLIEYYAEDELHNSGDLKNAIMQGVFTLYREEEPLSVRDAIYALTLVNSLDDAQNERWLYEKTTTSTINKNTQLHIVGRPLMLEAGASIILEEGADVIMR